MKHTENYQPVPAASEQAANKRAKRRSNGQFLPGMSGNPGGRPEREKYMVDAARSYTAEAIATLVDIMRTGRREADRLSAARDLLDRAWGKSAQHNDPEEQEEIVPVICLSAKVMP